MAKGKLQDTMNQVAETAGASFVHIIYTRFRV